VTDWIGSLRLVERTSRRVVLTLSRSTRMYGWALLVCAALLALALGAVTPWALLAPAVCALFGAVLLTLERRLIFDREAGVLRLEHRTFGIAHRVEVPLFHLRAVVVAQTGPGRFTASPPRYIAFVERRIGDPIYLDEARRCARLMRMAEAIAEVADVRLEYNARPD